jgi:7-cyano-7-deazaguanine synthase
VARQGTPRAHRDRRWTTVVLLSGGIDSAAALALTSQQGGAEALFVDYGQAAAEPERRAATALARQFGAPFAELTLAGTGGHGPGEIRGRNALLLHAALLARPTLEGTVLIAIHAGTPYPDCSPEFMSVMEDSFALASAGTVVPVAPFLDRTKADIVGLATELGVPLERTWSCEGPGPTPCGTCATCKDLEALGVR